MVNRRPQALASHATAWSILGEAWIRSRVVSSILVRGGSRTGWRATGARSVAVATGGTRADKLAESGADVVLPDLTDTPAVLSAILGGPYP